MVLEKKNELQQLNDVLNVSIIFMHVFSLCNGV